MKRTDTLTVALLIAGAFAIGVGGTVVLMSHRNHPPPAASQTSRVGNDAAPPDPDAKPSTPDGSGGGAPSDLVTLAPAALRNAGIQTEAVRATPTRASLTAPGTIRASTGGVAMVAPPVAGRVTALLVNLGDRVRVGQSLATLDSLDVAQAQAAVRQA